METALFTIKKESTVLPPDISAARKRGMIAANDIVTAELCEKDSPRYKLSRGQWGFPVPRDSVRNPHYYVFMTDCPDGTVHAFRENLMCNKLQYIQDEKMNLADLVPMFGKDWYFDRASLSKAEKTLLLKQNYIQMKFDAAMPSIHRKLVVKMDDPSLDTKDRAIKMDDLFT